MVFLEEFFGQIFSFNKAICSLAMEPQCSSQYTVEARTNSILDSCIQTKLSDQILAKELQIYHLIYIQRTYFA